MLKVRLSVKNLQCYDVPPHLRSVSHCGQPSTEHVRGQPFHFVGGSGPVGWWGDEYVSADRLR